MIMNNIIIAPAFFYSFEQLKPFVKSHLKAGVNGKILFLVEAEKPDFIQAKEIYKNFDIYVSSDIEISYTQTLSKKVFMYPFIYLWHYLNYSKILTETNISKYIEPWIFQVLLIHVKRYLIALNLLETTLKDYTHVMLTDTRDVIFQSDPFAQIDTGVYCGLESVKIFNEYYNRNWIEKLYTKETRDYLYPQIVSCSGVTLGDRDSILLYLEEMTREILYKLPKICFKHFDQAIHNFLIHKKNSNFNTKYCRNGDPLIATLGASLLNEFRVEQEKVYTREGELISVVHQYHPHPNLREWIARVYN
jgi:hypothetical protein